MSDVMPSPCVGVCQMSPDGRYCIGCGRTPTEIETWSTLSDGQIDDFFRHQAPERHLRTGYGHPVVGHPIAWLDRFFLESLDDRKALWSLGVPGAIVYYSAADGRVPVMPRLWEYGGNVTGAYGGIRIVLDHNAKKIKPLGWVNEQTGLLARIDLCLYRNRAMMSQRTTLTEIGLDTEALRVRDRTGILFDLGLGISHIDYCVRINDDVLLKRMRELAGQPASLVSGQLRDLLGRETRAHRVVLSRLGRIEVWGPVEVPDADETPRTRTIFDTRILALGQDREEGSPVPAPLYPIFTLYPGKPVTLV